MTPEGKVDERFANAEKNAKEKSSDLENPNAKKKKGRT